MVAFLRKVSALVVAAALILVSSVPAFAATLSYFSSPLFPVLQHFSLYNYSGSSVISDRNIVNETDVVALSAGGYTGLSYFSATPFSMGVNSAGNSGINFQSEIRAQQVSYSGNTWTIEPLVPSAGYYVATMSFDSDFDITSLDSVAIRFRVYDYNNSATSSTSIRYDIYPSYDVSSVRSDFGYYNTITIYLDLPAFYSSNVGSSDRVERLKMNYLVSGIPDNVLYKSFNFSVSSFPQYSDSTDHILTNGFERILSTLRSLIGKSDSDYAAVTDPSTSTEIQETQDMIDSVEGFESQLNSNITTEFNNINFTTPTNLAAPVAYVGDKVTRSINALGNYQPLIFVPLTLGIMLIFLGRGASSLGALTSRRSERDLAHDLGLDRNKNDERWLW